MNGHCGNRRHVSHTQKQRRNIARAQPEPASRPVDAVPQDSGAANGRDSSGDGSVSNEQHAAEEAQWQLPETTLPGPVTKGDVLVLTKARLQGTVDVHKVYSIARFSRSLATELMC